MSVSSRVRRCKECKQVFASPESYLGHKRAEGCRSPEALVAAGYVQTPKGWIHGIAYKNRRTAASK